MAEREATIDTSAGAPHRRPRLALILGHVLRALWRLLQLAMLPVRRLTRRPRALEVIAFRGYGTPQRLRLRGMVREKTGATATPRTTWQRLGQLYRGLASRGEQGSVVRGRAAGVEHEARSDHNGFFALELTPQPPLPADRQWQRVTVQLETPRRSPADTAHAETEVLVPPPSARFVVVSDIDDTVVKTGVEHKLRMLWTLFTTDAASRVAFPGVAAFYRALHDEHGARNPLLYVSRAPWSIYPVLEEFFQQQRIPVGPVLFLRDWGIRPTRPLPRRATRHKADLIDEMLETFERLPFIFVGDSGQRDPEIYLDVVRRRPERVLAVYIRIVGESSARRLALRRLAARLEQDGGPPLVVADDTLAMAEHAARMGFIAGHALPEIRGERQQQLDAAAPRSESWHAQR